MDFEVNDKDNEVWMDNKGKILRYRQVLWQSEIPMEIIQTIRGKCEYFDVDRAVVNETDGKAVYYLRFEKDNQDCEFWTERNGNLLEFRKELKESEIPASILDPLKGQYPSLDIDDAKLLEEAGKTTYHLDVEINDKEHLFWFDGSGKMLKHKQDLRNSEIPAAVMTSVSSMFPGYEIRDADKITEGGNTIFEIELRKSKDRVRVIFNPQGEVVKSTAV